MALGYAAGGGGGGSGASGTSGGASGASQGAGSAAGAAPRTNVTPNFLGQADGPAIPIPRGASGPTPVANGQGVMYTGGNGGNGLNGTVSNVRIMDPTLPSGPSPGYPNGYVNYTNGSVPTPQSVNPYTGQTVGRASPWWHIPLGP
jgi:hypothetical protein